MSALLFFFSPIPSQARIIINGTPWNPNPEDSDGNCLLTSTAKVPDSYCTGAGLSKPADECVQNPWIFYYNAECVGSPKVNVSGGCIYEYGWHQQVCSTADTCVAGDTGLRPGICDASRGGCVVGSQIYKTCCDGTTPVACQGGEHTGTCGSATAKFCGFGSYPACGDAACASLGGSPAPTTPSGGGTSPTPGSGGGGGGGECPSKLDETHYWYKADWCAPPGQNIVSCKYCKQQDFWCGGNDACLLSVDQNPGSACSDKSHYLYHTCKREPANRPPDNICGTDPQPCGQPVQFFTNRCQDPDNPKVCHLSPCSDCNRGDVEPTIATLKLATCNLVGDRPTVEVVLTSMKKNGNTGYIPAFIVTWGDGTFSMFCSKPWGVTHWSDLSQIGTALGTCDMGNGYGYWAGRGQRGRGGGKSTPPNEFAGSTGAVPSGRATPSVGRPPRAPWGRFPFSGQIYLAAEFHLLSILCLSRTP